MKYKVLTLWQPWATLLVMGEKKIETRPKPTTWTVEKGTYLIHAASKWTKEQLKICQSEPFKSTLERLDYYQISNNQFNIPLGCIIGSIEVTECKDMVYGRPIFDFYNQTFDILLLEEKESAFGNYSLGRFAWITKNPRILQNPIPYKGGQGYYVSFKGNVNDLIFKP
jgi:activating signal cointegrator 1